MAVCIKAVGDTVDVWQLICLRAFLAMLAAVAALLAILLIGAAITGQWAFLVLGFIAVAAALVPIISRR